MSRVVRLRLTKRPSSGTQSRRVWMLTWCQRFVLMFEWDTFCPSILRRPVISLFAMANLVDIAGPNRRPGGRGNYLSWSRCQGFRAGAWAGPWPDHKVRGALDA